MTDIIRLDAATLAAKIAAKELSSTEVTQAFLDQIAATDQHYGAFLHIAADAALAAAGATDKSLAAGERPAFTQTIGGSPSASSFHVSPSSREPNTLPLRVPK